MPHRQLNLDLIKQNQEILGKMYDVVRILNPVNSKVICFKGDELAESDAHCFDFWGHESKCANCIAVRAYKDQKVYFKLERNRDKIYMITVIPIKRDEDSVVLELIKDVTSQMIVADTEENSGGIFEIINNINHIQTKDSLTGMLNRGFIDERLPIDIAESQKSGSPLSILLIDIDRFKNVNDTYGHVGGDHVLQQLAKLLMKAIASANGWAARYGGEEFLLALVNTGKKEAINFAETLRKEIEQMEVEYSGQAIKITASIGINTLDKAENISPEVFVDGADKNLYKAKNTGRNKVMS